MAMKPVPASPMTRPSPEPFFLRGLLGCLLGTCIGILNVEFVEVISFGYQLDHHTLDRLIPLPIVFALCGIIAGAIRGRFLRRATQPALLWLLLSALGWSFAGITYEPVLGSAYTAGARLGAYLFFGALVALPQWLWLQRSHRNAPYWIVHGLL
jgi:hypothetical protein